MPAEPARFPNNPIVQHLLAVQRINAEAGKPAGRNYPGGGTPVDAGIVTRVSSAAMGGEIIEPRPLSSEERAERDRLAQELGIVPKPEDENERYGSLDDALAAGESVKPVIDPMMARKASVEQPKDLAPEYTARAMIGVPRSRLINFKRIQSIDLSRGVAVVDDFEIEVPQAELRKMKKLVLDLAVDYVTMQLAAALQEVMSGNEDQTVPEVRIDGHRSEPGSTVSMAVPSLSEGMGSTTGSASVPPVIQEA